MMSTYKIDFGQIRQDVKLDALLGALERGFEKFERDIPASMLMGYMKCMKIVCQRSRLAIISSNSVHYRVSCYLKL